MAWDQIEPTAPHLSYLVLSTFLIIYALFSLFIRNRLHIAEPPLATLAGIILGPRAAGVVTPAEWGLGDNVIQEITRVVVGVQCFAIGAELPKKYFRQHWKSVAVLIGPVMAYSWLICGLFIYLLFNCSFETALVISACLTPTDPVLASSVLGNSVFSERIPRHIKNMLSAESGCNDGTSFPFLYIGLSILQRSTFTGTLKKWFLITILWQCVFGTFLGVVIGRAANWLLKFSNRRQLIAPPTYLVFYLLLAIFCIGVASTLGIDDFLVAFAAGASFAHDGWFSAKTAESSLGNVVDLLLNSTMFVYFGASIPWSSFESADSESRLAGLTTARLFVLLLLVLAFRRIPVVLALKPLMSDLRTWREALFAGHFGPMGVGALFLAIEARAQLETGTSIPLPYLPLPGKLPERNQRALEMVWPVICFVVLGSIIVHGLSTLAISVWSHFARTEGERAPLIGAERDGFGGMIHDGSSDEDDM
ncbi:Na/H antiporter-like protein [Rhizodiscina lignyota]|uniref:Na/H antiporter-like protein n=1 Tax=Rhizodiscina lignyota TaxID=1504668 RepID=A0A9P4ICM8_9PEZI|nr:Na/H antiporter-like protein [Rhizodiscina lignyota]